jgi:hypothetical protein
MLKAYSFKLAAILVFNLGLALSQAQAQTTGFESLSQGEQIQITNAMEEDRAFEASDRTASLNADQYCCTRVCGPHEGQFCRYIPASQTCDLGAHNCK